VEGATSYVDQETAKQICQLFESDSDCLDALRGHPKPANESETRDVDFGVRHVAFVDMSNVLNEAKNNR
jgi:hypothetical protein